MFNCGDLIFAKKIGKPWWPAKVTQQRPGRVAKYDVCFYGTSEAATIKSDSITEYNKTSVAKYKNGPSRSLKFPAAMEEIKNEFHLSSSERELNTAELITPTVPGAVGERLVRLMPDLRAARKINQSKLRKIESAPSLDNTDCQTPSKKAIIGKLVDPCDYTLMKCQYEYNTQWENYKPEDGLLLDTFHKRLGNVKKTYFADLTQNTSSSQFGTFISRPKFKEGAVYELERAQVFMCAICKYRAAYLQASTLRDHFKKCHLKNLLDQQQQAQGYHCGRCKVGFQSLEVLKSHLFSCYTVSACKVSEQSGLVSFEIQQHNKDIIDDNMFTPRNGDSPHDKALNDLFHSIKEQKGVNSKIHLNSEIEIDSGDLRYCLETTGDSWVKLTKAITAIVFRETGELDQYDDPLHTAVLKSRIKSITDYLLSYFGNLSNISQGDIRDKISETFKSRKNYNEKKRQLLRKKTNLILSKKRKLSSVEPESVSGDENIMENLDETLLVSNCEIEVLDSNYDNGLETRKKSEHFMDEKLRLSLNKRLSHLKQCPEYIGFEWNKCRPELWDPGYKMNSRNEIAEQVDLSKTAWFKSFRPEDILCFDTEQVSVRIVPSQRKCKQLAAEISICDLEGNMLPNWNKRKIKRENFLVDKAHVAITGFTTGSLMNGDQPHLVREEFKKIVNEKLVIASDVMSDLRALEIESSGNFEVFDLQDHYKQEIWNVRTRKKEIHPMRLSQLYEHLFPGLPKIQLGTHSSAEDAKATMKVFREHYMLNVFSNDKKFSQIYIYAFATDSNILNTNPGGPTPDIGGYKKTQK